MNDTRDRLKHRRLAQECEKLNAAFEQQLAEEGLAEDSKEWTENITWRSLSVAPLFKVNR